MPVRVPAPPSAPTELEPLLRRRLVLVATIAALTATFFSTYRRTSPGELNFYLETSFGTGALIFEATFGGLALALAGTMWFVPRWFTLARLRTVEFLILGCFAIYIGWTQLFAWNGRRFGLAPGETIDPFFVRLAVDSMAARWFALIVGISVLVPETFRRNNMLVALQAGIAMTLTVIMSLSDPAYRPHFWRIVALMLFWMGVASTVAIFGAYKMAELRRQVAEARRFGQYQLIRQIGGGGMGEVHLAEHVLLKQPCAIKLIRPERAGDPGALERFEREVRATAQLKHWNTVQIYDYGYTDDGTFYYAMEYLPGLTLEEIVSRYGPLPPARTIHLLRQLCAALREAHGMNLVHRDIKPANVMVCERGGVFDVAKLLDFGLVRGGGPQAETMPGRAVRGRHARLHGAGAGHWTPDRWPHRHLLAGRRRLLPAHRSAPVRPQLGDPGDARADDRGDSPAARRSSRSADGRRRRGAALPQPATGSAFPGHRQPRRRPVGMRGRDRLEPARSGGVVAGAQGHGPAHG